ncbi:NAD(P)H-binding protein [Brevundimonas abyssalis]|uniref:NAD(P)H-binding protein n=1 Tax=Brevundimonas abyssalis TaxID=1125965 RepID=UPI000421ADF2|nr:NAD(P)H-binding protein [Brevundimonas abyssalis]
MTASSRLVTVFGGSGFIGGQAVRELARLGWRIRVAVRKPNTAHDLRPLGDVGQIQLMRCDVTRQADVEAALRGADAVVNLVGTFNTRRFQAMHVDAARYIAEAAPPTASRGWCRSLPTARTPTRHPPTPAPRPRRRRSCVSMFPAP